MDKNKPLPRVSVDEVSVDEKVVGGNDRGWRPWTLSTGVLLSAIFFTAGLVILIGLLQWQQFRHGALFAVSTTENFSVMQDLLNRYLPTVIVVLYGMGWSWIDLDIKRLEPWYQLAGRTGVPAEESLLLHYPLDFLPFVPFKAAKRKQWVVVSASTIMVLVVWAVTPLQNGIFSNNILFRSKEIPLRLSPGLLPVNQQNLGLSISTLDQIYATTWLGQQLAPFTTRDFALQKFELDDGADLDGSNATVRFNTVLYGTEFKCHPQLSFSIGDSNVSLNDGNGCNAKGIIPISDVTAPGVDYMTYFKGYFSDSYNDTSLQSAGCGVSAIHTFLAIWKRAGKLAPDFDDPSNATALFCTPSYYQQQAIADVRMPEGEVVSVSPNGLKKPLGEDQFNITRFEYIAANGAPPEVSSDPVANAISDRYDVIDVTPLYQDTQLINRNLAIPTPNMLAFAIGATRLQSQAYSDPQELAGALQQAYKMVFASAISAVMVPADAVTLSTGTASGFFRTVSLVPVFAILSQAFLLIVAACTGWLLYLTQNRKSRLVRDPDSLAQIMSLTSNSELRQLFNKYDSLDQEQLSDALKPHQFVLANDLGHEPEIQCITTHHSPANVEPERPSLAAASSWKPAKLVRPFEYSFMTRMGICCCLATLIASLVVLRKLIHEKGGLPIPSSNTIVQQILINYIPTSIATFLEPFFVLLSRLACLMRPLNELREGNVPAKSSLLARYTSLPPQLVVWRALRDRKFALAGLCLLALLANVLTVAFSGLLSINEGFSAQKISLQPLRQAKLTFVSFQDSGYNYTFDNLALYSTSDAFFIADSNFSQGNPLPNWTSQHYYVLPMQLAGAPAILDDGSQWKTRSKGYSADLDCQELTQESSDAMYELDFGLNAGYARFFAKYKQEDGSTLLCRPQSNLYGPVGGAVIPGDSNYTQVGGDPAGRKAFEMYSTMNEVNRPINNNTLDPCNEFIVRGWVRAENGSAPQSSANETTFIQPQGVTSTFISCKPRVKSAMLDLTMSSSGSILAAARVSPEQLETSGDLDVALNTTRANFNGDETAIVWVWHSDTIARDWGNYLMAEYAKSRSFLDVTRPPPTFAEAANLTSDVFSRLFAIQMSLSAAQMAPAEPGTPAVDAQLLIPAQKIFMSENLFWISLVILSLDLIVLVLFYMGLPKPYLPRIPLSIASQIAYFAGSHVVDDVRRAGGDLRDLDKRGYRYGYGKYIGRDGWTHVGIERVPFVTDLNGNDKAFTSSWSGRWHGRSSRRDRPG